LRESDLYVLYIRQVATLIDRPAEWQNDPAARRFFARVLRHDGDHDRIRPLYSMSDSPADTITDIAATFGVDTVILCARRRGRVFNLLTGNVVARVAASLPESIHLMVIG
jgi:nucleotide-binding universal stress UspA family protein